MQFKDILGHQEDKLKLTQQVEQEQIPHAQIFLGRTGSAKLAMALAYACYILCEDRQNGDACGSCKSCIKSMQYKHPDFHFAFPVVKKSDKKREDTISQDYLSEWRTAILDNPYMDINSWSSMINADKTAPNINTKECNEMIKQLGMRAFESKYKIQLIWLPEFLGKEGNRLLKMIEEPTDNTIIILVAEDQERILNTVLSRCQLVKIKPTQDHDAITYLSAVRSDVNIDIIRQAVLMADGNMNKAIQIIEGSSLDYSDMLLNWMRISYKRDYAELNDWINHLSAQGREDIKYFVEYAMSYLREYAFYLQTDNPARLNESQQKTMVNMKKIVDMDKVESITLLMQECRRDIVRNINPRISLMVKSIELGDILKSTNSSKKLFVI